MAAVAVVVGKSFEGLVMGGRGKNPTRPAAEMVIRGGNWIKGKRQKKMNKSKQSERRIKSLALVAFVTFCSNPAQSDDWRQVVPVSPAATPRAATAAAYPGPIVNWLTGQNGQQCRPGQPCAPHYVQPARQQPRQPSTYADPASQQPQLAQVQVNAPDLSKYALKSDLQNYVTRDEAMAALKQLQQQAGTLGEDQQSFKQRLEELVKKTNQNFSTVQEDLKSFNAAAADKVAAIDEKVSNLAATPAGAAVVAAGGNWLDSHLFVGAAAILTNLGLPGLGVIAGVLAARKFLVPKLPANMQADLDQLKSKVQSAIGGGGGAAADPFRGAESGTRKPDPASDPENYRSHR